MNAATTQYIGMAKSTTVLAVEELTGTLDERLPNVPSAAQLSHSNPARGQSNVR